LCYTEEIGDLCVFLFSSHPFSSNSIYFMTFDDFSLYNLATRTSHEFEPPRDAHVQPHWTPPSSF
ncbi:unnamed protein product, partial [Brassica napus]